jgi:hypothetical protein
MAIVIAHAQRLWGFFNNLAHQLYDIRLREAEREVMRQLRSRLGATNGTILGPKT